jgi:hypothetical protein
VSGTNLTLHYRSDRQRGFAAQRVATLDLRPIRRDPRFRQGEVTVRVAGQQHRLPMDEGVDQLRFEWDGRDGFGRALEGAQEIEFLVRGIYEREYLVPRLQVGPFCQGRFSWYGFCAERVPFRAAVPVESATRAALTTTDARAWGLGGSIRSVKCVGT